MQSQQNMQPPQTAQQARQGSNQLTTVSYPPPPTPLLPPAVNVTPSPTLAPAYRNQGPTITSVDPGAPDVHQLNAPTATGAILNLQPGEHPIERAAVATQQLRQEQGEKKTLEAHEQQLKTELAQREDSIRKATHEIREATEEIRRTHNVLAVTVQETEEKEAALRKREQADTLTIKEILQKLEHPNSGPAAPMPMPGADDHTPMRP
jgi:hypothetical protein